jgi:pimeloyl-ACP methyl ester carboxylesterase
VVGLLLAPLLAFTTLFARHEEGSLPAVRHAGGPADLIDNPVVRTRRAVWASIVCLSLMAGACGQGVTDKADKAEKSGVREAAVHFKTSDGRTLTGRLFGSGRVGITLGHMFPADAQSWYGPARVIAKAGYMTLAFNFRGYGDSGGTKQIAKAPIDVEAAKEFLHRRGAHDVAFVGASMGGTASLVAAEADADALAIVAISAPPRFMGLDAAAVATRVQRPVLLMASRDDQAAFASVQELERALPNPDTKIYDGDAHGTNLLDARPEAVDEIVAFLERYAPLTRSTTTSAP